MPYGRRGGEITINTQLVGSQLTPSVAGFASGGFVVVWSTTDTTQDGAGRAVKAQRYDAAGNPVGPEILVNNAVAGDQRAPSVTTLPSGGFVVTWETTDTTQDGSGTAIKGQVFDAAGVPLGAEFRVNSNLTADQTRSSVTGLEGGGFVVTWQSADPAQDGNSSAIKGQIYSAAGVALGAEFLVNTGAVGGESAPNVTSLASGGFIATWTLGSGQNADIYAQVFDSNGAKAGGQFRVNSTTPFNQDAASVTQLADGRIVVTWASYSSTATGDAEIRGRLFSASGTPIGNDFVVSTTRTDPDYGTLIPAMSPQIADTPDGGFVITWTHFGGSTFNTSIRAQYFDAGGARVGGEVIVSTVTDRVESNPDTAVDGNGAIFTVWSSSNSTITDYDIRGQLFTPQGAPEIVSDGGGSAATLTVAENQTGVTTVAAVDPEGAPLTYSIVGGLDASRFTINASTGVLTFVQARNFEARQDFGGNNVYDVVVSVSDGVNTDIQALRVAISNVNEGVTLTGGQPYYYYIENGIAAVADFNATDADGDPVTYSLSGADAARFTIDAAGLLRFAASPNFEAPADAGGNNIYDVVVTASDGSLSASHVLAVEILNQDEAPYIVSGGGGDSYAMTLPENTGFVMTIVRADPDANPSSVTYSIVGGADAARFFISAQTGQLFFTSARNFEAPADAGANNVYDVIVSVSDGFNPADTQAIAVTITNVNEGVTITSNGGGASAGIAVAENGVAVATVTATDLDGTAPTFSIAGGADAASFTIDPATGALRFAAAPDFEAPGDANGDNVYNVIVAAGDGSLGDTQAIAVTVGNVNENVVITSDGGGASAALSVVENGQAVTVVAAADADGTAPVYSISGGADAARFAIDAATGALIFVAAPDFEAPSDAGGDNVYDVVVSASDGTHSDSQALAVAVSNANEGVTLSGSQSFYLQAENGASVATIAASDADGDSPTFSIAGGADASLFTIDASTGELRFAAAPDFETPADAGGDNRYDVVVAASDGSFTDSRALTVEVLDQEEGPVITSGGGSSSHALTVEEGAFWFTSITASDPDADPSPFTFSIVGGADANLFSIDPQTGALLLNALPDFEAPADAGGDNVYDVIVAVGDGAEPADTQSIAITVGDIDEHPGFAAGGTSVGLSLAEGQNAVGTFAATDPEGGPVTYSIAGGADAHLFTVDAATGALSFLEAPDFEAPGDEGEDNFYNVIVTASDGTLNSFLLVQMLVGNVNEGVSIVSPSALSIGENQAAVTFVEAADVDGDAVTYAIAGGADAALFAIDAATGALSFLAAPDFEAPGDADGDNVYDISVSASDGSFTDTRTLSVSVGNANDVAPVIAVWGESATWNVPEDLVFLIDLDAGEAEGDTISWSLSGADAALFAIDSATGALSFAGPRDFETWGDEGFQSYQVTIIASDGLNADTLSLVVNLTDVNEGVTIISNGGGATGSVVVGENGTAVGTVSAVDEDRTAPAYSIAGGADAALFAIDAATGALRFLAAPDFEAPGDAGGDNVYEIVVAASDGSFTDTQALAVTVMDDDDAPAIATAGLNVDENVPAAGYVLADDADGDDLLYSIVGGADAALFAIDAATGLLSFLDAPSHETPGDAGGDNVYDVLVRASDGNLADTRAVAVTVGDVNEGVTIGSYGGAETAFVDAYENGTSAATVAALDADGDPVAYAIAGGADAALFTIDAATGQLSFLSAPDFEAPADADGNNVYKVVVSAGDGSFTATQSLSVTVRNVNEGVSIVSNGGAAAAALSVAENGLAVATVAAVDADGSAVSYAIAGGADAARFTIDAASGALRFIAAPNHEAPGDAGGNNVYDVIVSASDGSFTDTQALAVTVTNVREGNTIIGNSSANNISTTMTVSGQPRATELEDTIYGNGGNDTIAAAGGADIVDGGVGNDVITGGLGADLLTGGLGADRFNYNLVGESGVGGRDMITDFSRAQGDKISLNGMDANSNAGGNQNFLFIGTGAFSGVAGQLRYEQVDGKTVVSGDVNGDRVADFLIDLNGLVNLISSDFIL